MNYETLTKFSTSSLQKMELQRWWMRGIAKYVAEAAQMKKRMLCRRSTWSDRVLPRKYNEKMYAPQQSAMRWRRPPLAEQRQARLCFFIQNGGSSSNNVVAVAADDDSTRRLSSRCRMIRCTAGSPSHRRALPHHDAAS